METLNMPTLSDEELDYELQEDDVSQRVIQERYQDSANNNDFAGDAGQATIKNRLGGTTGRHPRIQPAEEKYVEDGKKRGVRLINSFLGGVDSDNCEEENDDFNPLMMSRPSVIEASRKSIRERIERRVKSARRFGITLKTSVVVSGNIDACDLRALFNSLDVSPNDPELRRNSILAKSVAKMTEFDVKRIFAEHRPTTIQFIDDFSCTIRWADAEDAARMLLDMTKPLRRVRHPKKVEEGELLDENEDEEAGQLMEENGDDVAVAIGRGLVSDEMINAVSSARKRRHRPSSAAVEDDFTEIDIEKINVPPGKWRVVTRHVPKNRVILLRFATGFDIRQAVVNARNRPRYTFPDEEHRNIVDDEGYEYSWKTGKTRVRPGLNVFDEKGNELEWDYEHDTRFFASDSSGTDSDDEKINVSKRARKSGNERETEIVKETTVTPAIRSRGRGAKKFLPHFSTTSDDDTALPSTLASDVVIQRKIKQKKQLTLASADSGQRTWRTIMRPRHSVADDQPEEEELDYDEAAALEVVDGSRSVHHGKPTDNNDDGEPDLDPRPTPQPWD